jgi:hypothetical protein
MPSKPTIYLKCGLAGLLGILACGPSWGLELPPELFSKLKSEEFKTRESAQAELLAWARERTQPAIEELLKQSGVADDPEVRARCLGVLQDLVNDEYLTEGEGYIGIRMLDEFAVVPGDPKPRCVIRLIQVVPDSAGAEAGLLLNDLIAGLGDQSWHEGPASLAFGEQIRQLKPNTKVNLKVLRDGKLIDVEVKLGRRPLYADHLFFDPRMDPEVAERGAKDAYFRRWLERRKSGK